MASNDQEQPEDAAVDMESSDPFKVPEGFLTAPKKPDPVESTSSSKEVAPKAELKPAAPKGLQQPGPPPELPYTPPPWASEPSPDAKYSLDVLKTGVIVENIDMAERVNGSFLVVGRLAVCDVVLEHPSISRYHAILQYGKDTMDPSKGFGWHLYDLGSTHGSSFNKQAAPPKQFIRVHVGHVLQFGGSTRLLILQGPEEDIEPESKHTVTEIRKEGERRKLIAEGVIEDDRAPKKREVEESPEASDSAPSGISWGMDYGEEGDSGREGSGGEELDFESMQKREEYYKDDPKKALTKFFEREGYELKFEYEEVGGGFHKKWHCRIELPVDTPSGQALVAQAEATGAKRDAQQQCALEACRILDAHGVLRRSGNAVQRKKLRDLKANDFYDSDEDTFYDRTGELEEKRIKRKRRLEDATGEKTAPAFDTYATLVQKLDAVKAETAAVQAELSSLVARHSSQTAAAPSGDSLDEFMASVRKNDGVSALTQDMKLQKSQLSLKLVQLKRDADRLGKLVKIATPVALPELKMRTTEAETAADAPKKKAMVWVGSMKGHRLRKMAKVEQEETPVVSEIQEGFKDDELVEEDEEDDNVAEGSTAAATVATPTPVSTAASASESVTGSKKPIPAPAVDSSVPSASADEKRKPQSTTERLYTVGNLPVSQSTEDQPMEDEDDSAVVKGPQLSEQQDNDVESAPKRSRQRQRQKPEKKTETKTDSSGGYDVSNPDYAMWMPPDNQQGDGRTKLNDKFGDRY
uniref:FHA domain-containing protein n=1 Tax=Plectus sambesii TaxID=2011161 RepID=A0A914W2P3_9BILA